MSLDADKIRKVLDQEVSGSVGSIYGSSGTSVGAYSPTANVPMEVEEALDDEIIEMTDDKNKAKKELASLIPMADTYLKNEFNVLLIGLHGTGKTESVKEIAQKHKLNFKYFSCSTLDPYTDLVGVPVPMRYCVSCKDHFPQNLFECPQCGSLMPDALKMIRPRDVDEAEFILFDEFNRADAKTLNAIFEIIQFRSINGERLPNLKCCWAAMNPPDKEYQVEEVDPALLDRFDIYQEIKPKPSPQWMVAHGLKPAVAGALKQWWDEQDRKRRDFESYVSPRRLYKIGMVYQATGNSASIKAALPIAGKFDVNKLVFLLETAIGKKKTAKKGLGKSPADFSYTAGGVFRDRIEIAEYLRQHPDELETHKRIGEILSSSGMGAEGLVRQLGEVINSLLPAIAESFFNSLPPAKQSQMRRAFVDIKQINPDKVKDMDNLENILSEKEAAMQASKVKVKAP